MSAQLGAKAAWEAGDLYIFKRQIFHRVPALPATLTLQGKTALVTGANSGLGLACARQFLQLRAARVVMAVRSADKGEAAAGPLRREFPGARVDVWIVDMASPGSVRDFAARCARELDRVDVAVLNAGMGMPEFVRVEEGGRRETTLQTNYLGTALLALLLLPLLRPKAEGSAPGRLTIITSDLAGKATLPDAAGAAVAEGGVGVLDSIDTAEGFEAFTQYGRTKLLLTMFVARLAKEISADDVIVNCCNPSAISGTAAFRDLDWLTTLLMHILYLLVARGVVEGAKMYLHAAMVLGKESHGSATDWAIHPYNPIMYTDRGRRISDKLWDETMAELRFAGVEDVLRSFEA